MRENEISPTSNYGYCHRRAVEFSGDDHHLIRPNSAQVLQPGELDVNNLIEGAVITFVDVTEARRTRDALQKDNALLRLAVVVRDAHDAITVQTLDGQTIA